MKYFTALFLLLCLLNASAQNHQPQISLNIENILLKPVVSPENNNVIENGVGYGTGIEVSTFISKKMDISIGVGYRFRKNKYALTPQDIYGYSPYTSYGYSPYGYGYSPYGYDYGSYYDYDSGNNYSERYDWIDLPQQYVIVPLKVRFYFAKCFFAETSIETTWLLNYEYIKETPEYNWGLGIGYRNQYLGCSLKYSNGFTTQGMNEKKDYDFYVNEGFYKSQTYHFRMFILNISVPLWKQSEDRF